MSQKEKHNDTHASAADAFVNACWAPFDACKAFVQNELQKQDELLRQTWQATSLQLNSQRERNQQLYQEMIDSNPFLSQSEAMKNIALQAQAILKTPVDFTFDLLEKADAQRKERLQVMASLQDQFISAAKQNQSALFRLVETSMQKSTGA
ncbi:MAG: hypothetical protein ACM32O_02865 [Clostridia bacterium]